MELNDEKRMENMTNSQCSNQNSKDKKLIIVALSLLIVILAFMFLWFTSRGKSRIVISEEEIDYILLDGYDVQIGNIRLDGDIDKRLEDETAKKKIVEYMNSLGVMKHYRQGDPILGTPTYKIEIFLHDEGTITMDEGGIIIVSKNDGEQWYDSNESFQELFYELYME